MYLKMYFNMQLNMYDELLSKQISIFWWEEVPLWKACAIRNNFQNRFAETPLNYWFQFSLPALIKPSLWSERAFLTFASRTEGIKERFDWERMGAHGRASLCVTKVCSAGLLHHCPHGKRRPSQNERWVPSKLAFNLLVLTPILQPSKYWVF